MACAPALLGLSACGTISRAGLGIGGGDGALAGVVTGNRLMTDLPLRVVRPSRAGIADVYLTDIPREVFERGGDLSTVSGTIAHLHVFLMPEAGETPISRGATSAIVRVVVLTGPERGGQAGVYGGGGFFLGDERVDDDGYSGTLRSGTLHLTRATSRFDDALGPSVLRGSYDAVRDDALAARISDAIDAVLEASLPVRAPGEGTDQALPSELPEAGGPAAGAAG